MNNYEVILVFNFLGLLISMIGFILFRFIMKRLNANEYIKRYGTSGYIIYILPILIALTNLVVFVKFRVVLALVITLVIFTIQGVLRIYDVSKLKGDE
ncbi:hypothetical protein [Clostridium perfringens]|uniref:hypothetical protein n=1 Tax=Clostridium perfringens TaxID=1502 RepID=UPI0039ECF419